MDVFQDGLLEELLDELVHIDDPSTFNTLVHLCLQIKPQLQWQRSRCASPETRVAPAMHENLAMREELMEIGAA